MTSRFDETLYAGWGQYHDIDQVVVRLSTGHQELVIFDSPLFGRVLTLDGIVQTTSRDEFVYHEMLTHVPLLSHGSPRRVGIIGGGDGGILREVLRHRGIEEAVMVEMDRAVVDLCAEHLPAHSAGAFGDPRFRLEIADGAAYLSEDGEAFDVIIVDSTDPIGPGQALFAEDFYRSCARRLSPGGIVVTQNGVAFLQLDEVRATASRLEASFADVGFYSAAVPTYVGGIMTFGWGSDTPQLRRLDVSTLRARFAAAEIPTRYYTPEVHVASFALPRYVVEAIAEG